MCFRLLVPQMKIFIRNRRSAKAQFVNFKQLIRKEYLIIQRLDVKKGYTCDIITPN